MRGNRNGSRVLQAINRDPRKACTHAMRPAVRAILGMNQHIRRSAVTVIAWRHSGAQACETANNHRDRKAADARRRQYTATFGKPSDRVRHMLKRIGMNDEIEGGIEMGQRLHIDAGIVCPRVMRPAAQACGQHPCLIDFKNAGVPGHERKDGSGERLGTQVRATSGAACALLAVNVNDLVRHQLPFGNQRRPQDRLGIHRLARAANRAAMRHNQTLACQ